MVVCTMDQSLYDSLTTMERNCLRIARHDMKSEQIGHELGIAASTVNTHIFAARRKLGGLPRLTAADQLRQFETIADVTSPDADAPPSGLDAAAPQPMSRQALPMVDPHVAEPITMPLTEVRERRAAFVFDDDVRVPGGQERKEDDALRRLLMLLAIAALVALVLIAAPAIYDSTAQRIANSLERPHQR